MNPASVLVASLLAFLIPHASSGRTLVLSYIGAAGSKKIFCISCYHNYADVSNGLIQLITKIFQLIQVTVALTRSAL